MAAMTLSDVSQAMREMDFCMLSTHAENGDIAARPMSTNADVEYQGNSYFFALSSTHTVAEIEHDNRVALSFSGTQGMLGQRPLFIAVQGRAELIRDLAEFEAHWTSDLDRWFTQGMATPGLVLIKVKATRITYWNGSDEGEITP